MSYSSRIRRQRNPGHEKSEQKPLITGTVQKLSTSKEEEKTSTNDERMKMDKDIQEKAIQRVEATGEEKEPVQKMEGSEREDKTVEGQ